MFTKLQSLTHSADFVALFTVSPLADLQVPVTHPLTQTLRLLLYSSRTVQTLLSTNPMEKCDLLVKIILNFFNKVNMLI